MFGPAWASTMASSASASSMAVAAVSLVAPLLLCSPASSLFAPPSFAAVTSPRGLSVIRRGGERSMGPSFDPLNPEIEVGSRFFRSKMHR